MTSVLFPAPGAPVRPIRRARPVAPWRAANSEADCAPRFSTLLMTRASATGFLAAKSSSRRPCAGLAALIGTGGPGGAPVVPAAATWESGCGQRPLDDRVPPRGARHARPDAP